MPVATTLPPFQTPSKRKQLGDDRSNAPVLRTRQLVKRDDVMATLDAKELLTSLV